MEKRRCKTDSPLKQGYYNKITLCSKCSNSHFDSVIKKNIFPKSKRSNSPLKQGYYGKITPCSKRSQVTLFIIIAIVLVAIIIVFFIIRSSFNISGIDPEVKPIDSVIEDCVEVRAVDAIRLIGLQGGYVKLPKAHLKTNFSEVAYGYYEGSKVFVSKKKIEEEIDSYLRATLPFCVHEEDFPDFNITQREASAKTQIRDDYVFVIAKAPISVLKDEKSFMIDRDYEVKIPIKLGRTYNVADEIINKEIEDPDFIDLTYLTGLDYDVLFVPVDEENILYLITDKESSVEEIPYSFLFANKFKEGK